MDVWFSAVEFYLDEVGVQPQNRVRAALRHFDAQSLYRLKSAKLDAVVDWAQFKIAVKNVFGKNEGTGSLQERLFAVAQRPDETVSRYGSRVLELSMKNFPLLSFKDQQQVALGHLLNGLADSEVQREVRLRLVDLGASEPEWSRAIEMLSLLEAEARAGRLRNPHVGALQSASTQYRADWTPEYQGEQHYTYRVLVYLIRLL